MNVFDEVEHRLNAGPPKSFRLFRAVVLCFIALVFLMIISFFVVLVTNPNAIADMYGRFYGRAAATAVNQFEQDRDR